MVDMDTKGRIDTIESKTPSREFKEFSELVLRIAMLALDIPYTAFNSAASSFSGMIADQNFYETSCKWKREKNKWARKNYSDWLLERIWNDPQDEWGLRSVAAAVGITRLRDIQEEIEWVPTGTPWLQKLQEVQGDIKCISAGIDNPIDICKRRGTDFFDNVRKIRKANEYAKANNVPIIIGDSGQATVEEVQAIAAPEPTPAPGEY
jgi:capsid protein